MFPQVSRTLLNILAKLYNAVILMASTRPPISKSSSLCIDPLSTVLRSPIKIGITITFMFHSFFSSLAGSKYLFFFLLSFSFTLRSARMAKSTIRQVLFFISRLSLDRVVWTRLDDLFVSRNLKEFYVSHFPGRIPSCAYTIIFNVPISISCAILSGSSSPTSFYSYIIFIIYTNSSARAGYDTRSIFLSRV